MNFRYLTDDESKNHHISLRRNSKYLVTNHLDRYLFSILDDISNYPIITKLIRKHKRYIRLKSTIYYICEQTSSTSTYVQGIEKVYAYQYKAILEITRNKCEDVLENDIATTEAIGELFKPDIKEESSKPKTTVQQYSTTAYSTTDSWTDYITTSNTSTTY